MPSMPSTTRSARRSTRPPPPSRGQHSAAVPSQCRETCPVCPLRGQQHGGHPGASTSEEGTGEQGIAAVVAGADQQRDPAPVDTLEQPGADRGQPDGGLLHEGALRAGGEQRLLGRPHLLGRVQADHGSSARRTPSATTTAEAIPPSWLSEMCHDGDAELGGPAGNGAPHLQVRTTVRAHDDLGVVPVQVTRGPERLGERLLGRETGGEGLTGAPGARRRVLLGLGEQPVAQARCAGQRRGEALDRNDVDPDPDDHRLSVPCAVAPGSPQRVLAHRSASWLTVWGPGSPSTLSQDP